jgi:hypothetical protein
MTKFLIIAGVQKGATSWLATWVGSHPRAWMAPKELHVFDVEFLNRTGPLKRHPRNAELFLGRLQRDPATGAFIDAARAAEIEHQFADFQRLQQQPETYAKYFADMARRSSDLQILGEKSPSYAMLLAPHWREIRARLEGEGFDVRVILTLRDPVERALSQYRFTQGKRVAKGRELLPVDDARVLAWLLEHEQHYRGEYRSQVDNLCEGLDSEQVRVGLFEELFTEAEARMVAEFLGLDYHHAPFEVKRNQTDWQWTCPDPVRARLRESFDETYIFARERFGAERIDSVWKNA